jgi:hypothetical protein
VENDFLPAAGKKRMGVQSSALYNKGSLRILFRKSIHTQKEEHFRG